MQDKISENTAKVLEHTSNLIWETMKSIIKTHGYSDTTLHLEGSVYELREIVQKSEIINE